MEVRTENLKESRSRQQQFSQGAITTSKCTPVGSLGPMQKQQICTRGPHFLKIPSFLIRSQLLGLPESAVNGFHSGSVLAAAATQAMDDDAKASSGDSVAISMDGMQVWVRSNKEWYISILLSFTSMLTVSCSYPFFSHLMTKGN